MNSITISGRLTKDAELKSSQSGRQYIVFTVSDYLGKDREGKPMSNFFECKGFTERQIKMSSYLVKGKAVVLSGKLQVEEWQDNNGVARKSVTVMVDNLDFAPRDSIDNGAPQQQCQQPQYQQYQQAYSQSWGNPYGMYATAPQQQYVPPQQQYAPPMPQPPPQQAPQPPAFVPPSELAPAQQSTASAAPADAKPDLPF